MLPNWDYGDTAHWGDLCLQFALCARGSVQSPIDLSGAQDVALNAIEFAYHDGVQGLFNNGHTVQVQCVRGSHIVFEDKRYALAQFHFHHPSEHTVEGKPLAMELHLVHQHLRSGEIAVVAVLIDVGEDDNPRYAPIFDHLPRHISDKTQATPIRFDPSALLPDERSHFYAYAGSLTTPPCSENVRWFVLGTPVRLSQKQVDGFVHLYANNARPVQPRNERPLLHT